MYPETFTGRDVFNFDLQSDGGLTYRYYNGKYGKVVYEFGHGLSYTTFKYEFQTPPVATVAVTDLKRPHSKRVHAWISFIEMKWAECIPLLSFI